MDPPLRSVPTKVCTIEVQLREIVKRSPKAEMALAPKRYKHWSPAQLGRAGINPIAHGEKSKRRFGLDLTCCGGYKIVPLTLQIYAHTIYG